MWINCSELIMIILTTLILSCNGFWWRTTTEATPMLRQMPISYFRTYTYHQPIGYPSASLFQPMSYNQYSLPSRFAGWSQFPSASNGVSVLSNYKQETTTTASPIPTTTTTPVPTQPPLPPSTHTPLLQAQSPMNMPLQSISGRPPTQYSLSSSYISSAGHHYIETHPPKAQYLSTGPIRTSYLTPDYPNQYYYSNPAGNPSVTTPSQPSYNNYGNSPGQHQRQQIRFVPCMCPVTVAIAANEFPESRANLNEDNDDMILPENDDNNIKTKDIDDTNVSS